MEKPNPAPARGSHHGETLVVPLLLLNSIIGPLGWQRGAGPIKARPSFPVWVDLPVPFKYTELSMRQNY
jgi:hypothetical protein